MTGARPKRGAIAIAVASGAAFVAVAASVATAPGPLPLDESIVRGVRAMSFPILTSFFRGVTAFGGVPGVTLLTTVLVLALWWRGRTDSAVVSAVLVLGGTGLNSVMKSLVGRSRPPVADALIAQPSSTSFPSGHTMASLCFAAALWYVSGARGVKPRTRLAVRTICVAYVVSVALSRVYLGMHWPSDVLAGWLLGACWIASFSIMRHARREA